MRKPYCFSPLCIVVPIPRLRSMRVVFRIKYASPLGEHSDCVSLAL